MYPRILISENAAEIALYRILEMSYALRYGPLKVRWNPPKVASFTDSPQLELGWEVNYVCQAIPLKFILLPVSMSGI